MDDDEDEMLIIGKDNMNQSEFQPLLNSEE